MNIKMIGSLIGGLVALYWSYAIWGIPGFMFTIGLLGANNWPKEN